MIVDAPGLLWLLVLAPLVAGLGLRASARVAAFAAACAPSAEAQAVRARAGALGRLIAFAETACLIAAVLALAGISLGERVSYEARPGLEVILIIDVSNSMLATDAAPTRLERARSVARSLVAARPALTWGLVAARGQATLLVPPTDDLAAVDEGLDFATPDALTSPGTRLAAGIRAALSAPQAARRVIVLFSDGDDLSAGTGAVAAEARALDSPIFAMGFGGTQPVPVSDAAGQAVSGKDGSRAKSLRRVQILERIAQGSGGVYLDGEDPASLPALLARIDAVQSEGALARGARVPADRSGLFSLIAALALLLRFSAARLRARGNLL